MKPENDNIKKVFSSKLKSFEPELPPLIWEKIDTGLSTQPNIPPRSVKKFNFYKFAVWASSAAAIILALVLLYPTSSDKQEKPVIANNIPSSDSSSIDGEITTQSGDDYIHNKEIIKPESNIKEFSNQKIAQASQQRSVFTQRSFNQEYEIHSSNSESDNSLLKEEAKDTISPVVNTQILIAQSHEQEETEETVPEQKFEKDLAKEIAQFEAEAKKGEYLLAENSESSLKEKRSDKGFQISAGGGGALSKGRDEQIQLRKVTYLNIQDEVLNSGENPVGKSIQKQKMKMEHHQPISFGVTISKNISNKISLETGIIYTYASSKFKSEENLNLNTKDSQHFHYLGVPLSINYNFLEWKKVQFYLSAGGLVQKDFYGRINTVQSTPNEANTKETVRRHISQDHAQFSLTSSLGASYPIYNRMSLYANFGSVYNFKNHNEYETIYTDRRWMFNMNFGLRFGF